MNIPMRIKVPLEWRGRSLPVPGCDIDAIVDIPLPVGSVKKDAIFINCSYSERTHYHSSSDPGLIQIFYQPAVSRKSVKEDPPRRVDDFATLLTCITREFESVTDVTRVEIFIVGDLFWRLKLNNWPHTLPQMLPSDLAKAQICVLRSASGEWDICEETFTIDAAAPGSDATGRNQYATVKVPINRVDAFEAPPELRDTHVVSGVVTSMHITDPDPQVNFDCDSFEGQRKHVNMLRTVLGARQAWLKKLIIPRAYMKLLGLALEQFSVNFEKLEELIIYDDNSPCVDWKQLASGIPDNGLGKGLQKLLVKIQGNNDRQLLIMVPEWFTYIS